MWYNRLNENLLKERYVKNLMCPCIFIKESKTGLRIIAVYVDDLNLIGTPEEYTKTSNYLKKEFKMEDLGKNKILSRHIDKASFKWHVSPLVDIYRECIKALLYWQIASTQFSHSYFFHLK